MMLRTQPALTSFALTLVLAASSQAGLRFHPIRLANFAVAAAKPDLNTDGSGDSSIPVDLRGGEASASVHTAEGDDRIARADRHFEAGRQFYFEGNLTGARREFDSAVDVLLNAPDALPDHRRIERRLEEICDTIFRFDVEKLGAGQSEEQESVVFDKAPIDEISHMTFAVDPKLAPKLKSELNQTASGIPLELSDEVLGFVHYFSTDRGRKILLAGLKRSGRYRALIQKVFAEEGVPEDLIYLAQAESGFLPRAMSNKQAGGMWQFIVGTGSTYDLARTSTYDDRFDPEKATHAAAKYLKDLYARYGDWYLAMAGYNCGAGAVDRAVERTGYADYWQLLRRHALPKETASYVPIILAMTIMAKNPTDYGLENLEVDPALEYDSIRLTAATNLNLLADATLQPVSALRDLNPSLLRMVAPVGFEVHVPKGASQATLAALAAVPELNRQAWRLHHVEAGDTLAAIARTYHMTADRIVSVNRAADSLETGDVLLIPAAFHEDAPAKKKAIRVGRSGRTVLTASASHSKSLHPARATHLAASRHVPSQVLHRKAALRTASLQ